MTPLRYIKPRPGQPKNNIRWQGKTHSIADAVTLAIQEHQRRNFQAVAEIYSLILAQVPDYAEGHNNRGVALHELKQYSEALACYERAVRIKPGYVNAQYNRASTLKKLNRAEEALAGYDQVIALKPDHAESYNNRGVVLQEMKRYAAARASYDRAVAIQPAYAEANFNRGTVLVNLGEMAEAETMFRRAIELKPDFAAAWFNLAMIREHATVEDAEVKRIQALLERPNLAPDDVDYLSFTLGKLFDDGGRYDEAFEYYRRGNEVRKAGAVYDAGAVERMTEAIIGTFTKDFLAEPFVFASKSKTPLLIVGMPRSGTTLLASMLSNHPAIATAGELPMLTNFSSHLWEQAEGGVPFSQAIRELPAEAGNHLIQSYESRLRRDAGADVSYVIDKNPLNFRNMGLIAKLFPEARIIHCTRDPMDTGLSNYFQRFPLHLGYAFDLRNIGHFYGEYARLMAHWRTVPNVKWIEIDYANMILKTEEVARRALNFLGLEWNERCLAPHTNSYGVETASQWQVRQPIYQHSIGRWRHFEKHLGPLKEALTATGQISPEAAAKAIR
jgi:tetratricopeptide (TPR) repeat protein